MRLPRCTASPMFFLAGLALVYVGLSPLSIRGMGYSTEQAAAAVGLAASAARRVGLSVPAIDWRIPRHGLLEPLIELPFVALATVMGGMSIRAVDRALSLEPVLASALLCTLVFRAATRLSGSQVWGLLVAITAAFATLIWPYAYIGLETTQSLGLMLAAYLGLVDVRPPTWWRVVSFALACGIAVGVKSNGFTLVPAVGWLFVLQTQRWRADRGHEWTLLAGVLTLSVVSALAGANVYWQHASSERASLGQLAVTQQLVDGPLASALGVWAALTSANKGLFVYAPVTALAVASLPRAWRKAPGVVVFALLTVGGALSGAATLVFWADEVWGPRYLHVAVAPLLLCLAAAQTGRSVRVATAWPLLVAAILGAGVSLLGVLCPYGAVHRAARETGQSFLESLQSDPRWNPIRFDAALIGAWRHPDRALTWPPPRHRWFPGPDQTVLEAPPKVVELRGFEPPQPYLLRTVYRHQPTDVTWWACLAALATGALMLMAAVYAIFNCERMSLALESRRSWVPGFR